MRASDVWIEKLAMFISRRCDLFRWSAVFRRCQSPSSSTSTGSQIATWRRSLTWTRHDFSFNLRSPSMEKMFVWSPAFLPKPGSTRYSSAPSITTVWSNCQTLYNDFFDVYNSNTETLSPTVQKKCYHQFNSINVNQSIVVRPHWSNRLQLIFCYDKS